MKKSGRAPKKGGGRGNEKGRVETTRPFKADITLNDDGAAPPTPS